MKLLLTSGGVTNPTIEAGLVDLLGKPIDQATALITVTAEYGHPWTTPWNAWQVIAGTSPAPLVGLGWKRVGFLELLALPDMDPSRWLGWLEQTDVLLVDGGSAIHLAAALRACGLDRLITGWPDKVWVGVSAGSMVLTPRIGQEFVVGSASTAPADDSTLGVVDFSIFPHLDHPDFASNTAAAARTWASQLTGPCYALDDQSAIAVADGRLRVLSEGQWLRPDQLSE